MSAKVSESMIRAREMIKAGATAYRAAVDCDLTVSAITRSKWYKEFKAEQATVEATDTRMTRAKQLVLQGKTAYAAAKMTGLAQSQISRADWYQEFLRVNDRGE